MADDEFDRPQHSAAPAADPHALRCSFCGKRRGDVDAIVCGTTPSVAICNECVELCTEIIAEQHGG